MTNPFDSEAHKQTQPIVLTPKDLFVQSLERCKLVDDFMPSFYKRFMAASPDIAWRFQLTDFKKQNRMLLHSLELAAGATIGTPHCMEELRERAVTHDRHHLDVPPELYVCWLNEIVAAAHECDPEWNEDIEAAWREILQFVIEFLQARH